MNELKKLLSQNGYPRGVVNYNMNLYSAISVSSMALYNNCRSKKQKKKIRKIYTVIHFDLLKENLYSMVRG